MQTQVAVQPKAQFKEQRQESTSPTQREIRLLVLDIDGTLAGRSNQVSEPVQEAIQKAKAAGVRVAIATGRMHRSAERFHYAIQADMPLCSYQGALIRDPVSQVTLKHWAMDWELAEDVLQRLQDHPLVVHLYIEDQLYLRELSPLSQAYAQRSQVPFQLLSDKQRGQKPTKILAMSEDVDLISELLGSLRQQYSREQLYLTRSEPMFLEATHPAVNKGNAVRFLAEEVLGLSADQVMAIGDSDNDIEMIQYAGIGVAMGNASAALLPHADWVAPSVDQDGVAAAIETFILS
ncbi:Cof-type HAD-IIB family hydrolase [Thermostichus vulcanus]|uniref:HAD family phosphatase n=1 Tax=Thermostichus vulcanus str. 'Rupite' TaxID=2813851 RepID=A0ABT0C7V4_THEVL|nr:Cof-type HAD-IIB family hydrolase [Thermostichus vulcanus]MCJ2541819.1 HAD family phosphatase [Thermostichus vulcanus str. 'Rupite']